MTLVGDHILVYGGLLDRDIGNSEVFHFPYVSSETLVIHTASWTWEAIPVQYPYEFDGTFAHASTRLNETHLFIHGGVTTHFKMNFADATVSVQLSSVSDCFLYDIQTHRASACARSPIGMFGHAAVRYGRWLAIAMGAESEEEKASPYPISAFLEFSGDLLTPTTTPPHSLTRS